MQGSSFVVILRHVTHEQERLKQILTGTILQWHKDKSATNKPQSLFYMELFFKKTFRKETFSEVKNTFELCHSNKNNVKATFMSFLQ